MSDNIKQLTQNLATKLVSYNISLNDEILLELDLFLGHYLNDHRITTHNLDRLIDGFVNTRIHHREQKQQCDYFSLNRIANQCLLSKNWGKANLWNKDNASIRKDVYTHFSSNLLHFIDGFNDELPQEIENTDSIDSNSIVLINNRPILKTLVSSKSLTDEEIEEFSKIYDLLIHGISRILQPQDFTNNLIKLALMGIREITIPDNKESETRLFRDFDKEATSNLMLLTGLIDVTIGGILIKSEQQVLNYCSIASKTTSASQLADIRKIQCEWIKNRFEDNKSETSTMGHFKGSFNKIMTRAILVERCRNNEQLLNFFSNNLQDKIALVDDNIIMNCITKSMGRAFKRLSEKLDTPINTINQFFVFDNETLLNGFKELMEDVEVTIVKCRIDDCNDQILSSFELCLKHLIEAQNNY